AKRFCPSSIFCPRSASEKAEQQIRKRRRQQGAVDDIEDAAEAGDDGAAVFDLGVALEEAFEEVAGLAYGADDGAENQRFGRAQGAERIVPGLLAGPPDQGGGAEAAEEALPRLARAEPGDKLVPPERPAAEVGADVGERHHQQDP